MKEEVDVINQTLPATPAREKTAVIQQWMSALLYKMERYKTEHSKLIKEAMTLLELALWKANLDENESGGSGVPFQDQVIMTRGRVKRARKERCVTSGATIVITNVLPFLV